MPALFFFLNYWCRTLNTTDEMKKTQNKTKDRIVHYDKNTAQIISKLQKSFNNTSYMHMHKLPKLILW